MLTNPEDGSARIRSVFLDPDMHDAVKVYADANGMSVSEVIREAMASFTTGKYPTRKRTLRRVTMWIDPGQYAAFAKKARDSDVTIRHALELALDETL